MYRQETINPYREGNDKSSQVEQMFDHIAPSYDKLNHRLSWDIDKSWRRKAIVQLSSFGPKTILDVATGTGDFAILSARMLKPEKLIGVDISEGMMNIGQQKVCEAGLQDIISFRKEDCLHLTFGEDAFDAVTAAFGIRNFQDLDACLREICRVLKPGGHLSIVELSRPIHFPMKQLFWVYSHTLLPLYGKMVSRDDSAYSYLIATIEAFPQGEQMKEIIRKAGFSTVQFRRLTFGICTMYLATK
jgi:demethylmenaquinone methyltransferase/2-methoxy-6-polyprenyl-1,4-benzoquinol methylase